MKDDEKIYLIKHGADEKKYNILLENDVRLYKNLTNKQLPKRQLSFQSLIINVTLRCNIKCPICYTTSPEPNEDLSIHQIKDVVSHYKKKTIVISGGEPTVREDLHKIIEIISKENTPLLATNGIKLADYDYVLKLKEHGLKNILFSFNGLDDKIYQKTNGKKLLKTKLDALKNIERVGMSVILSVLIVREVNDTEEQLKKLFDFFIKNKSFIKELKLRVESPLGRHLNKNQYKLSELLELVSKSFQINKSDILNEIEFMGMLDRNFGKNFTKSCKIDFFFRINDGRMVPIIDGKSVERVKKSRFKRPFLLYYAIKSIGLKTLVKQWMLDKKFINYKGMFTYDQDVSKISLRVWPNKFNIDIEEDKICKTGILQNGKFVPFCYANILSCG